MLFEIKKQISIKISIHYSIVNATFVYYLQRSTVLSGVSTNIFQYLDDVSFPYLNSPRAIRYSTNIRITVTHNPHCPTRVSDPVRGKQDCVVYVLATLAIRAWGGSSVNSLQLVVWNRWVRYLNTSKHFFNQSLNKRYLPSLVWNRKACFKYSMFELKYQDSKSSKKERLIYLYVLYWHHCYYLMVLTAFIRTSNLGKNNLYLTEHLEQCSFF